ncbi:conjugal transfer protein TraH [Candidatus Protochlamydia phocaeensis]|uniref:conjugal transfer protein TraH n=1 Tax=Candidatus Protochlamydia phocaeensis TaxID=1414722 RepID=UPI000838B1F1|nr:conjugal transfer protein TraH [Candidatus Protochlamydia phocaeensis]
MIRRIYGFLCYVFLASSPLCADLNKEMNHFFHQFGSTSNVNSAEIYNGQKAGYMTGGGISIRNRVMNTKLATVSLPRFDAGCGGIDIFAGGFSFINHKQLVQTLKSIGSNAKGYAFLLGLETVSPQTANTIKQLQSWANNINGIGINSCETASQLVGSVWPANTAASQQICRSLGNKDGKLFSDFIDARHQCSNPKGFDAVMEELQSDEKYRSILMGDYNIAWEAMQKQEFLSREDSKPLKELLMSLMGTIIVRREKSIEIERWPSKIEDESFLKVLLDGGQANGYSCGVDPKKKCLVVVEKSIRIEPPNAWIGKVKERLINMQNKIIADEEIDNSERELLDKSRLPLYKIVNVLTAYKKGYCPIDLYQVADIVAMDLLIQYLREAAIIVREGCTHLRREQMFAAPIDDYLVELDRVEQNIRYYETRAMTQMEREFQMMHKIDMIENQIASELILN